MVSLFDQTIWLADEMIVMKSTIQTLCIIVERHPEKMGIRMWINGVRASVIQDRRWV